MSRLSLLPHQGEDFDTAGTQMFETKPEQRRFKQLRVIRIPGTAHDIVRDKWRELAV